MDDNEVFYTIGEKSGQRVKVEDVYCCGRRYIRTRPDDVQDNNLDSLRSCKWSS